MQPTIIQFIYRNYKPLHEIYRSITQYPPTNIEYITPTTYHWLKKIFPLYHKIGTSTLASALVNYIQRTLFEPKKTKNRVDILHYLHMLPSDLPSKPFIVDIEHVTALNNYQPFTEASIQRIKIILTNHKCKKIVTLSRAATSGIKKLFGSDYSKIEKKVFLLYPASLCYYDQFKDTLDNQYIPLDSTLKILFVGSHVYRKGLHELLSAVKNLHRKGLNVKCYVVSDADNELRKKYAGDRISFYPPAFLKKEIIRKFYLPADVFVMPTHWDTFGMAYLDALASGTPVITTNQYCSSEIVRDRINGFLINSDKLFFHQYELPSLQERKSFLNYVKEQEGKLVHQLEEKITYFYDNRDEVKRMGENALRDFREGGKFSLAIRNNKLIDIYLSSKEVS